MEFKDYYATLGVERTATQDEVKRAYRKLARKYHPDVSKEPDAEARFKEVTEAHEALFDPERRAAYDDIAQRHASGQPFEPPPGWNSGFEYSGRGPGRSSRGPADDPFAGADFSDFFESLFGRGGPQDMHRRSSGGGPVQGRDHHAKVAPTLDGHVQLSVPPGSSQGRKLRLKGKGLPGKAPGDLYAVLTLALPPSMSESEKEAYCAFAGAFADYNPRAALEA